MIRYFLPLLLLLGACQAPNQYDADGNIIAIASKCSDSADCPMAGECDKDGDCPMQEACDAGVSACCADKGDADCDMKEDSAVTQAITIQAIKEACDAGVSACCADKGDADCDMKEDCTDCEGKEDCADCEDKE